MDEEKQPNQQLSKKQLKRLRRIERKQGQAVVQRRHNIKKRGLTILVILVVAALIVIGIVISNRSQEAKPGQVFDDQGRQHINVGSSHPPYNSNPPTSGWHYPAPANWGVYTEQLADEQLIHNLEHGGIWISYRDRENQELINQLENLVSRHRSKVILTWRPENDTPLALAAWQRLLKLDGFDEARINEFIQTFKNKGPELVPD